MAFLESKDLLEVEELFIVASKYQLTTAQDRGFVQLTMARQSTSENLEAPTTNFKLYFPKKDDALMTRSLMQSRIKDILGALIEIEKGASIVGICDSIKKALVDVDVKVRVQIKKTVSKTMDKEGNPMVFTEIEKLEVLDSAPKAEFEEFIDFTSEVPF